MKSLNETIEEVRKGAAWLVTEELLYYLDQARTLSSENKRLTESVTKITDEMAAYRCSWGEMYKDKFGKYPEYPF